jgi:hypothetical protein
MNTDPNNDGTDADGNQVTVLSEEEFVSGYMNYYATGSESGGPILGEDGNPIIVTEADAKAVYAEFNTDTSDGMTFDEYQNIYQTTIDVPGSDNKIIVSKSGYDPNSGFLGVSDENGNRAETHDMIVQSYTDLLETSPTFVNMVNDIFETQGWTELYVAPYEEATQAGGTELGTTFFDPNTGEPVSGVVLINEEHEQVVPEHLQGTEEGDQYTRQLFTHTIVHEMAHYAEEIYSDNMYEKPVEGEDGVEEVEVINGGPGAHGPQHSQLIASVMREYLEGTAQDPLFDTEEQDYSLNSNVVSDSVGDGELDLMNEKFGFPGHEDLTVGEYLNMLRSDLKAGNFNRVTEALDAITGDNWILTVPYTDPQTGEERTYRVPAEQWMMNMLVHETFDQDIGAVDETEYSSRNGSELDSGAGLLRDLRRYYDFLEYTTSQSDNADPVATEQRNHVKDVMITTSDTFSIDLTADVDASYGGDRYSLPEEDEKVA